MDPLSYAGQQMTKQPASQPNPPATVIDVSNVSRATEPLREVSYKTAVEALITPRPSRLRNAPPDAAAPANPVEACSRYHGQLVAVRFHPVVAAVHFAFNDHRPLALTPDALWLLVAQGFANHVNAHAEVLRPQFVQHQGRAALHVRRDDFIKGSPENPWGEVFSEFGSQIRDHIGAASHDLLSPDFSTTGPAEKTAAEIVLIDAMQSYFSYDCHTLCGIPQIVLEGTTEDWTKLAQRTRSLGQYGLEWWTDALAPILDEFVAASRGRANVEFWKSIYKLDDRSGGPYTTGWLTAFFPYLKHWETGRATIRNRWLLDGGRQLQELLYPPAEIDPDRYEHAPTIDAFPAGLSRAPFCWNYHDQPIEMEMLGGFVGVRQEAHSLRLRPEIGWAVRDQVAE